MLKTSSPHFHPFPLSTTRSVEAAKAMGVAFNSSARIFTAAARTLFTAWVASWTSLEIGWGFEDLLYGYAIFFQVWMMQWCRDAFQPWAKSSMVSNATAAKGEVLPYGKMARCHGKSWEATAQGWWRSTESQTCIVWSHLPGQTMFLLMESLLLILDPHVNVPLNMRLWQVSWGPNDSEPQSCSRPLSEQSMR